MRSYTNLFATTAIALALCAAPALAQNASDAKAPSINYLMNAPATADDFRFLLAITGEGQNWVNRHIKQETGRYLYCVPDDLALVPDQYLNILQRYLATAPGYGELELNSLGLALLNGLLAAFPCK
ncbi:hypothetical protein [Rhizobium leguminosarum]|uniref:hypothetical protein n=1 Tax=Rhizobium leguminosarum TaxID=384 RepID=UPI001C941DE3|nr:hypothetical protein [Rhizobium leguminosarum]MBY5708069.1 hypothetical protein [Rhizobium leguminosarum]